MQTKLFRRHLAPICLALTVVGASACHTTEVASNEAELVRVVKLPNGKQEPTARSLHTATWTGDGMLIWGGMVNETDESTRVSGGIYYPSSKRWFALPRAERYSRYHHTAIWDGKELLTWGGVDEHTHDHLASGFALDPKKDTWHELSSTGAPSERSGHSAIWTGQQMVIWGGESEKGTLADGAVYDPEADKWEALPTEGAPSPRSFHSAIWAGTKMIIWGGTSSKGSLRTGGVFDAESGQWSPMSMTNAPSARISHTVIWTGTKMIVWGGRSSDDVYLDDGGIYDPATNQWTKLAAAPGAPSPRELHTAVWTGHEMIVWGGHDDATVFGDGAAFNPDTGAWRPLAAKSKLAARYMHTAVWSGTDMLVFGGRDQTDKTIQEKRGLRIPLEEASTAIAAK